MDTDFFADAPKACVPLFIYFFFAFAFQEKW